MFSPDIKQVVNVVTDGMPNVSCDGYGGSSSNEASGKDSAEAARNYLLTKLQMTSEKDRIDAEGIGITEANRNWLRDSIVWPQFGQIAPPFPKDYGWVRVCSNFTEFAETIGQKFEVVTQKFDFGDAPDPSYPTYLASDGARHIIPAGGGIYLGALIDDETDGLPDANAVDRQR